MDIKRMRIAVEKSAGSKISSGKYWKLFFKNLSYYKNLDETRIATYRFMMGDKDYWRELLQWQQLYLKLRMLNDGSLVFPSPIYTEDEALAISDNSITSIFRNIEIVMPWIMCNYYIDRDKAKVLKEQDKISKRLSKLKSNLSEITNLEKLSWSKMFKTAFYDQNFILKTMIDTSKVIMKVAKKVPELVLDSINYLPLIIMGAGAIFLFSKLGGKK